MKWRNYASVTYVLNHQGGHKPGILAEFFDHGILREFCATSGKNYYKENNFGTIEYLRKTTADWVKRIIMISGSSYASQLNIS